MKRFGEVIKVKPEKFEEYKKLHNEIWPSIVQKQKEANMQNFTIFYRDGYLFKYFEYVGDNYEEDMQQLAADEENNRGLPFTDPGQEPSKQQENRSGGLRWKTFFIFYKKEGIRL